jgi:hypothetical protein
VDLETLCSQINSRAPVYGHDEHDIGSKPIWQVVKAWVEDKEGQSILCGTVEVWDQRILDQIKSGKRGVSISYGRGVSGGPENLPMLRVDPHTFDPKEIASVFEEWARAGIKIQKQEHFRKAQLPPAQLILDLTEVAKWAAAGVGAGFVGYFGEELAKKFCHGLSRLFKSAKGPSPAFILLYDDVIDGKKVRINISIPYTNTEEFLNGYLLMAEEITRLSTRKLQSGTQSVYLRYSQNLHTWEIEESKF